MNGETIIDIFKKYLQNNQFYFDELHTKLIQGFYLNFI